MNSRQQQRASKRLGAVAVEFAVVLPFLMAIVVGLTELTRVYDVQNLLETGAREGARFAAMDRSGSMPAPDFVGLGHGTLNQAAPII